MNPFKPDCDKNFYDITNTTWWNTNKKNNKNALKKWCNSCLDNDDQSRCKSKKFWDVDDTNPSFNESYPQYKECFINAFNEDDYDRIYQTYSDDEDGSLSPYKLIGDDNFNNEKCLTVLGLTKETKILSGLIQAIIDNDFYYFNIQKNNISNYFDKSNSSIRDQILIKLQNIIITYRNIESESMFINIINLYTDFYCIHKNK